MLELLNKDPRHYQILFLTSFLTGGLFFNFIDIELDYIAVYLGAALFAQYLIAIAARRQLIAGLAWNWKSALISGLSLCLLLRVPSLFYACLASAIAIFSKLAFKVHNKHVFNPANFAIVVSVILLNGWISPGQWGNSALLVFMFAGLGFIISMRAARADVALVFLVSYSILVLLRAIYLGDPLVISFNQLSNGALFLFAFFMITDPRTSPNHKYGRAIYALSLALGGYMLQFHWHLPQGMLYALVVVSVFVPVLNSLFKALSYEWPQRQ